MVIPAPAVSFGFRPSVNGVLKTKTNTIETRFCVSRSCLCRVYPSKSIIVLTCTLGKALAFVSVCGAAACPTIVARQGGAAPVAELGQCQTRSQSRASTSVAVPSHVLGQLLIPRICPQRRQCLCNDFEALPQFSGYPRLIG